MRKFLSIFLQIILLAVVFASTSAAETIAVLDFKSLMADEELGVAVAEILKTELAGLGEYTIIERGMLEQILEEQALQLSGAVDTDTAVKIGKLAGANVVVTGSVVKTGEMYTINSRFIEVETGIVKIGQNIRGQGESQISNMVQQLALMISGKAVVTEEPAPATETPDASGRKTPQDEHAEPVGAERDERPSQHGKETPPRRELLRELVEACLDKNEGTACQVERGGRTFTAKCHSKDEQLACLLSREDAPKRLQVQWERLDLNHDGFLNLVEFLERRPRSEPQNGEKPPSGKK